MVVIREERERSVGEKTRQTVLSSQTILREFRSPTLCVTARVTRCTTGKRRKGICGLRLPFGRTQRHDFVDKCVVVVHGHLMRRAVSGDGERREFHLFCVQICTKCGQCVLVARDVRVSPRNGTSRLKPFGLQNDDAVRTIHDPFQTRFGVGAIVEWTTVAPRSDRGLCFGWATHGTLGDRWFGHRFQKKVCVRRTPTRRPNVSARLCRRHVLPRDVHVGAP